MRSYLTVIYGVSPDRNDVAWRVARALPGKAAVLSLDALLGGSIAGPSEEADELEMVHTQLRLLTANYMRNGYHVVVEGRFFYDRDGDVVRYEQDIDQLIALMRNMTARALTVHLEAGEAEDGIEYRRRTGPDAVRIEPGTVSEDACKTVLAALREGGLF